MDKTIYQVYLKSAKWKKRRKRVLIFWDHKCVLCNNNGGLHVHHRTYERIGNEILTDLIPLCAKCHKEYHNKLPEAPGDDQLQGLQLAGV